jgi:hypothetical protein
MLAFPRRRHLADTEGHRRHVHDFTIRVDSLRYPICKAFHTQWFHHLKLTAVSADEQDFQMIELRVLLR